MIAVISFSCSLFISFSWSAEDWESDVFHPSVWKITSQHHCNNQSGTAFSIDHIQLELPPNQFITNFHVIKGLLDKECSFSCLFSDPDLEDLILSQEGGDEKLQIKKLLAVSAVYDLVLFETKENVKDYLSIAESSDSTEDLSIYGYPSAFKGDLRHIKKTGPVIYEGSYFYSFPVNQSKPLGGASGSPVLNTEEQVVGVAFQGGTNMITVTKLETLREFLLGEKGIDCSMKTTSECLEEAQEEIEKLSESGDAEAQYQLADYYCKIYKNPEKSFELYKQSAEQGNPEAQYAVGKIYLDGPEEVFKKLKCPTKSEIYYDGEKVVKDPKKAIYWLKKSAEQGYAKAQHELGEYYYNETADYKEAEFWLRKSDEQGHPLSPYYLATMYEEGCIEEKNPEEKIDLLKKSANRGSAAAQYYLGKMYYEGEEIDKNCKEAVYWLNESAKQGFVEPQTTIKQMEGTKDCTKTIDWSQKSIEKNCQFR